jgi:hypothetical protein
VSASAGSSNNLRMATPGERLVNIGPIYDERRTLYTRDITGTCPVDYRSESFEDQRTTWVLRLTPDITRGNDAPCAWQRAP